MYKYFPKLKQCILPSTCCVFTVFLLKKKTKQKDHKILDFYVTNGISLNVNCLLKPIGYF